MGLLFTQVPLPGHVRVIAGILQQRGQRHGAVAQISLVARLTELIVGHDFVHIAETNEMVGDPGQQHAARRRARGGCVKVCELHSFASKSVEIRRRDFRAVTAKVGISHVVDKADDNVGSLVATRLLAVGRCPVETRQQQAEAKPYHLTPPKVRNKFLWRSNLFRVAHILFSRRMIWFKMRVTSVIAESDLEDAIQYNGLDHPGKSSPKMPSQDQYTVKSSFFVFDAARKAVFPKAKLVVVDRMRDFFEGRRTLARVGGIGRRNKIVVPESFSDFLLA